MNHKKEDKSSVGANDSLSEKAWEAEDLGVAIDDYIIDHIDKESDYLHRLYRATHLHLLYGRMASGHLQGRLLKMFVTMIRPKLILELGTFSGYGGLCLAEGLEEAGMLHTVEVNDEQEDFTLPWFYKDYYDMVFPYVNPGGYIIADNTLWDGHVLETPPVRDPQTRGIMEFNDFVAQDERVEKVILPLRDGLSIIRVKREK